eukprot:6213807-Pleurochrysis_carterae.AAC.7
MDFCFCAQLSASSLLWTPVDVKNNGSRAGGQNSITYGCQGSDQTGVARKQALAHTTGTVIGTHPRTAVRTGSHVRVRTSSRMQCRPQDVCVSLLEDSVHARIHACNNRQ